MLQIELKAGQRKLNGYFSLSEWTLIISILMILYLK